LEFLEDADSHALIRDRRLSHPGRLYALAMIDAYGGKRAN
jgi:hypothetical protein